eukprot:jgi/Mesen1/9794/ME000007S09853
MGKNNRTRTRMAVATAFPFNSNVFATWYATANPCDGTWEGVTCDNTIVTRVDLSGKGLVGEITPTISQLGGLRELLLNDNLLTGAVPGEIGQLLNLEVLWLQNNHLAGSLPTGLGSLVSCQQLYLYNNSLTGAPPAGLSIIPDLRYGNRNRNRNVTWTLAGLLSPGNQLCSVVPGDLCNGEPAGAASAPVGSPQAPTVTSPPLSAQPSPPLPPPPPAVAATSPSPAPVKATPAGGPSPPTSEDTCKDCTGEQVKGLLGACTCVTPTLVELRFMNLTLSLYSDDMETALLTHLAAELALEIKQLRGSALTSEEEGRIGTSVRGTTLVLPAPFTSFQVLRAPKASQAGAAPATSAPAPAPSEASGGGATSKKSSGGSGVGIGIGIGAAILCLVLAGGAFYCYRRRRASNSSYVIDAAYPEQGDKKGPRPSATWQKKAGAGGGRHDPAAGFVTPAATIAMAHADAALVDMEEGVGETPDIAASAMPRRVLQYEKARQPQVEEDYEEEAAAPPVGAHEKPPSPAAQPVQAYSLKYLRTATNDFGKANLVGDGNYGRVYKVGAQQRTRGKERGVRSVVSLLRCQTTLVLKAHLLTGEVAVVLVMDSAERPEPEFVRIVKALGGLRSPGLLPLLGYCAEGEQRMLVHRFMPHASLQDHLHGDLRYGKQLNWYRRLQIATDIADALAYLHESVRPPLVHKDVKSGNILLDADFRAKLADYGMTALVKDGSSRTVSPHVLGSFAYQAPEFRSSGSQTAKSDCFSFGVILLEMLTGRKPLDSSRPRGQQSLLTWHEPEERPRLSEVRDALRSIMPPASKASSATSDNNSGHTLVTRKSRFGGEEDETSESTGTAGSSASSHGGHMSSRQRFADQEMIDHRDDGSGRAPFEFHRY